MRSALQETATDRSGSPTETMTQIVRSMFDVVGSRGKGRVTARFITVSPTEEVLGPGTLVMADGTTRNSKSGCGGLIRSR